MSVSGVHRIALPIPFPMREVHVYVIEIRDGYVLVDSGFPSQECLTLMRRELRRLCGSLERIKAVVVTHFHPDHCGLAGWIQKVSDADVYVHERDLGFVGQVLSDDEASLERFAADLFQRIGADEHVPWQKIRDAVRPVQFPIERITPVRGGEILDFGERRLELLWTPGHSEGHICVLDSAERVLFSGDHLLARITPHVGLLGTEGDNPLHQYENSLSLVERLAPRVALPGHEQEITDPAERAREIKAHHQGRRESILSALGRESKTAKEVSAIVFEGEQDGMGKFMALSESMAHLDALIREECVETVAVGSERRYRSKG